MEEKGGAGGMQVGGRKRKRGQGRRPWEEGRGTREEEDGGGTREEVQEIEAVV